MKILALDLGTKTGFALEADNYPLACGTYELASKKDLAFDKERRLDRRGDIRFSRLVYWLRGVCRQFEPDLIVFEDVQFASTSIQAHLWASFRAAVWLMRTEFNVETECCPVATLKKFATGSGAADKDAMARYLTQNPRFELRAKKIFDTVTGQTLDDNAVDALHLLKWAKRLKKTA